jgi:hypothetical protein
MNCYSTSLFAIVYDRLAKGRHGLIRLIGCWLLARLAAADDAAKAAVAAGMAAVVCLQF